MHLGGIENTTVAIILMRYFTQDLIIVIVFQLPSCNQTTSCTPL